MCISFIMLYKAVLLHIPISQTFFWSSMIIDSKVRTYNLGGEMKKQTNQPTKRQTLGDGNTRKGYKSGFWVVEWFQCKLEDKKEKMPKHERAIQFRQKT